MKGHERPRRRCASFALPLWLIEEAPGVAKNFFTALDGIVVRAEALYHVAAIDYVVEAPCFVEVEWGEAAPRLPVNKVYVHDERGIRLLRIDLGPPGTDATETTVRQDS